MLLLFSMDPYCSSVVTTDWTHACHLGNRWSAMFCCDQQTVVNKMWCHCDEQRMIWFGAEQAEQDHDSFRPIDFPRFFKIIKD